MREYRYDPNALNDACKCPPRPGVFETLFEIDRSGNVRAVCADCRASVKAWVDTEVSD